MLNLFYKKSTTKNFSGGCGGEVVQGSLKAKFKNQKDGG
jgi:hypothetical protein